MLKIGKVLVLGLGLVLVASAQGESLTDEQSKSLTRFSQTFFGQEISSKEIVFETPYLQAAVFSQPVNLEVTSIIYRCKLGKDHDYGNVKTGVIAFTSAYQHARKTIQIPLTISTSTIEQQVSDSCTRTITKIVFSEKEWNNKITINGDILVEKESAKLFFQSCEVDKNKRRGQALTAMSLRFLEG